MRAYFDLQVNGYAGVDFNADGVTDAQVHHSCEAMRRDGVEGALATIITDDVDRMAARLRRLVEARRRDELVRRVIAGLHVEGPFLSERDGFRGAHPREAIRPADESAMQRLLHAGEGLVRLVTLAPEQDPQARVTRMLAREGIAVAGGHSDATLDQLDAGIDAGMTLFTHLGNGCPMQMHRHDNIVQRVLSRADRLMMTFIADGVHVPYFALGNYLRLAGLDRCIVVTDAMAAAGLGPGRYQFGRWDIEVSEDLAAWAPGRAHLLGSAMSMPQADANLREFVGLSDDEARLLTYDNPRRAVSLVETGASS